MTNQRAVQSIQAWTTPAKRSPADATAASHRHAAILAGVRAGDAALARFRSSGALMLFMEVRRWDWTAPGLVALRTYAELRRVLLAEGHDISASSLVAAGFGPAEIACFDWAIETIPQSPAAIPTASR